MNTMLGWLSAALAAAAMALMVPTGRGGLARLRGSPPRETAPDADVGRLPLRVRRILAAGVGISVVLLFDLPLLLGAVIGLVVAAAAFVGLRFVSTDDPAARRERMVLDLPEVLDLLAAALAAGVPLRRAVRLVVDLGETQVSAELQRVVARIDVGMPDADSWQALADHPVLGETARDLARQVDHGTGVERVLRARAVAARTAANALRQRRARTVGVRTALPLAACFLPAFVMVGIVPAVASAIVSLWPS